MTPDKVRVPPAESRTIADWSRKATARVAVGIDRAHAHGVVALTEVLRRTPSGRPTLRVARRSRSYAAAIADLSSLLKALAGPSVASLDGLIRDAREALYRDALAFWVAAAPEGMGIDSAEPSGARIADVRGLVLHGTDLRREVGARSDAAGADLLATLEIAGRQGTPQAESLDRLKAWHDRHRDAITRSAVVAIGDSAVALDALAAIDAARPEYRPEGPHNPD